MSKSKYGKKVIHDKVCHRICGTCKWWRKNRPGQPVREHRCVLNHFGSAKSAETANTMSGLLELMAKGFPVEYVEGDGDNSVISKMKIEHGIDLLKRFDKNHIVKNGIKRLYELSE